MTKKILFFLCFAFLFVAGVFFARHAVNAQEQAELEAQIQEKTRQLEEIQARKREIEKSLEKTSESNKKLSDELKTINTTINQLNLSIQQNRVMIEKLNLEITSLGRDIVSTEDSIRLKKATMAKLFVELQQHETAGLLSIFLKNDSLSEGLAEAESLVSVNEELRKNLAELHALKGLLSDKLETQRDKKENRENEQVDLKNRQYIVEDEKKGKQDLLTVTKNQEKVYQQQLSALEKMQEEIALEIERIEAGLRKKINAGSLPGSGVLGNPVPGAKLVTQCYGYTPEARYLYKGRYHNGIDFSSPVGTPVYAAEEGRVLSAGNQDAYCPRGAYGRYVLVKHDNGLTTLYAHLSRYVVGPGTQVSRGELLGYVGKTGYATGPHLHFSVFATNTIPPASAGFPEGTQASRTCGPMPVGGDLNPLSYLTLASLPSNVTQCR